MQVAKHKRSSRREDTKWREGKDPKPKKKWKPGKDCEMQQKQSILEISVDVVTGMKQR